MVSVVSQESAAPTALPRPASAVPAPASALFDSDGAALVFGPTLAPVATACLCAGTLDPAVTGAHEGADRENANKTVMHKVEVTAQITDLFFQNGAKLKGISNSPEKRKK